MKTAAVSLFSIPFLFAYRASAMSGIDCKIKISVDKERFDFSKLDSPHTVYSIDESSPPAVYNTTWTVNICRPLKVEKSNEKDQCPYGTNICGIRRSYNPVDDPDREHPELENVIPVAGTYTHNSGKTPETTWTRLKSEDPEDNGLQLEIKGGQYGKRDQKAIIKFQCDPNRSGNNAMSDDDKERRDDDEPKDDRDLIFRSYGLVDSNGTMMDVLRLHWRTKYACQDYEDGGDDGDDGDDGDATKGWGVFTWFILILFLGIAAYLIFGSWLNYNRYGARGWDLLPHGDTIRDIPYLVKDWGRKVIDTVSGPGSRGGYSAV